MYIAHTQTHVLHSTIFLNTRKCDRSSLRLLPKRNETYMFQKKDTVLPWLRGAKFRIIEHEHLF